MNKNDQNQQIFEIFEKYIKNKADWKVQLGMPLKMCNFLKFAPRIDHFWLKTVILTPKMVKYIFEIISILTAAKNYASNFSDTPIGPNNCTSSKAYPTALSNQPYFQCIFQIFQKFCWFWSFLFNYFLNILQIQIYK